ncbi:hypothetical protein [Scatolibacter rhodanostii]|uniref:hypothetical protein n=1 Tax=Scatolibacter rhodanostii TaxID=2014781 RepID=UPI000C074593|nr:hypothetical protein [Scatolibacter rhodanostii]
MSHNKCPHCYGKINYIHKLWHMNIEHGYPCPHCQQNIALKNSGYKATILIIFLMAVSSFLVWESGFKFYLPILFFLFELFNFYFLKIIPHIEDKGISHNRCPLCHSKISCFRKFFLMHDWYGHQCPHCKQKVKLKASDDKISLFLLPMVVSIFFMFEDTNLIWLLPISISIIQIVMIYFTKIIPYTYDSDEEL